MAETLQNLSIISFAIAAVCFVLAIFFWFFFKIPIVISDLSGRTARKSIAKMRVVNEKTGVKVYKESKINAERGKVTAKIPNSGKINGKKDTPGNGKPDTGLLTENNANVIDPEETGMLGDATGGLDFETTSLLIDEDATASLDTSTIKQAVRTGSKKLEIIEEVMLINTDEVIQ